MAVASAFLLTNAVPAHAAKVPTEPRELARVNGEGGSYVVWLESPNGEVDVAVATAYPHRPVVAPRFMQTHTPSEIFLAVVAWRQAMPELLESEQLLSVEEETRVLLQRENADELAGVNLDFPREVQSLAHPRQLHHLLLQVLGGKLHLSGASPAISVMACA
ncbi:hypothetical protein [Myxococcus vastator]|uniref:hypothetical protein n=1 Tax=Myxococcus vastator TaxID=2709664 RepID=UPI0013D6E9FF|nr:hypothetical protein [Myxococcus vastator]